MDTRMTWTRFFVLGGLAFALTTFAVRAQAQDVLASLLSHTGLRYEPLKRTTSTWMVPFKASDGKTVQAIVCYSNDRRQFALIFVTMVDRSPHHVFSRALLTEAMKLNNDDVGVKYVLDEGHGDIDCQTEVYLPTATPASLKMALNNVASHALNNMERFKRL